MTNLEKLRELEETFQRRANTCAEMLREGARGETQARLVAKRGVWQQAALEVRQVIEGRR